MSPHDHDLVLHADLRHVIYALSDALDLVGIDDLAHGKRVLDEVHKFASTPMMKNWLASTYNGDEGVLGQLDTPSERAAFAFQMFMPPNSASASS